jgi:hypothetical protein
MGVMCPYGAISRFSDSSKPNPALHVHEASPCIIQANMYYSGDIHMKRFSITIHALVLTLIVSACGAQATPAINQLDMQSTAVASALTLLAQTQAARPTATLPSPTVVVPTNTLETFVTATPLPTLEFTLTPAPTENPSANDPCITNVLPDSLTGKKIKIRIDNPTKGTINLTVYLQQSKLQSVCGYRAYVLGPQDSLVINDLVEGCYSLWAWNPDPKDYFMVTNGTSCLNNSSSATFDITDHGIKFRN